MENAPSTFLFILRETTPERYAEMSRDERYECLQNWNGWCDALATQGRLQAGSPLEPQARVVSAAAGGGAVDGPFAEAKEMIGGYLLVSAADLEEATALAESSPSLPFGMSIEVRPIAPCCHLARSLGWNSMREPTAV